MSGSGLRERLPWWARLSAKVVLSRLPVPYAVWKRLRVFEHGDMHEPQRALGNLLGHASTAGVLEGWPGTPRFAARGSEFHVLEIGPGDSLFSAMLANALGASRTWLIDAGPFARMDAAAYAAMDALLRHQHLEAPPGDTPKTLAEVLRRCQGIYLTEGLASLRQVPTATIDFCFSNAVLEHIDKREFVPMVQEFRRVLKPDGVATHRVDLKDHLGGGLAHLRFSDAVWEGRLFRNSGFYTNRIRFGEMVNVFVQAGFDCSLPRVDRWAELPLKRCQLDRAFRQLPDAELLVSGFDIVLTPQRKPG